MKKVLSAAFLSCSLAFAGAAFADGTATPGDKPAADAKPAKSKKAGKKGTKKTDKDAKPADGAAAAPAK